MIKMDIIRMNKLKYQKNQNINKFTMVLSKKDK